MYFILVHTILQLSAPDPTPLSNFRTHGDSRVKKFVVENYITLFYIPEFLNITLNVI